MERRCATTLLTPRGLFFFLALAVPLLVAALVAPGVARPMAPLSATHTSGEQESDGAGPRTAYVDPAHASAAAARAAAVASHEHHAGMKMQTDASGEATTVAAAALDPAVYGQWNTLAYKLPLRAIHATLLHTGKFL